jgi:hypothetical protein
MYRNEVAYIDALIQLGLLLGFVVSLISLIWSGVQWATAKKEKAKRARAKRRALWSLAGAVAIFLIYFVLSIIIGLVFE